MSGRVVGGVFTEWWRAAFPLEIIAKTCELTNMSISTKVQGARNNNPAMLFVTANATFAITLKENPAPQP